MTDDIQVSEPRLMISVISKMFQTHNYNILVMVQLIYADCKIMTPYRNLFVRSMHSPYDEPEYFEVNPNDPATCYIRRSDDRKDTK